MSHNNQQHQYKGKNAYRIFHQNVEEEIVMNLKKLHIKDRLKCIAIQNVILKKKKLDEQLEQEIQKLKEENEQKTLSYIKKQNSIIGGEQNTIDQTTLQNIDRFLTYQDNQNLNISDSAQRSSIVLTEPGIQQYWQKVFLNCQVIHIDTKDQEILKHVEQVKYERNIDENTFSIIFYFKENIQSKYFRCSPILKKTFYMLNPSNPIKSRTFGKLQCKLPQNSFFNFFDKNADLEEINEKWKKEQKIELFQKLGKDFEISLLLSEEIIPYSLEYFLGVRKPYEKNEYEIPHDESDDKDIQNELDIHDSECVIF